MPTIACPHCTGYLQSGGKCGGCGYEDGFPDGDSEGISEADAKGVCRGCGRALSSKEKAMGSHFTCECGEQYP